ncbi:MAG: hypothetical protein ACLFR7_11845 [Opitutales bacterium]
MQPPRSEQASEPGSATDRPHDPAKAVKPTCGTAGEAASCGGRGRLCPGVALLVSLLVGSGLANLTGQSWLVPVCAVAGTLLLSTGLHRRLNPFHASSQGDRDTR